MGCSNSTLIHMDDSREEEDCCTSWDPTNACPNYWSSSSSSQGKPNRLTHRATTCGSCNDTLPTPAFNLDIVHPSYPPFLGAAILVPQEKENVDSQIKKKNNHNEQDDDDEDDDSETVPESAPLDSDEVESSSEDEHHRSKQHPAQSVDEHDDEEEDDISSKCPSSPHDVDESLLVNVNGEDDTIGQMLLQTDESTSTTDPCQQLSPTRLFNDNDENDNHNDKDLTTTTTEQDVTLDRKRTPAVVHHGVIVKGKIGTPQHHKNITCQDKLRRMSTLPSTTYGQPMRLRVTESYIHNADISATFDPYFSYGQYNITTANGSSYGNGLQIVMSTDAMTLQEADTGKVVALMRSRHTSTPSSVIYGTAPRYPDQPPSAIDDQWYPWALVQKNGRSTRDDVTVQFATHHHNNWGPIMWRSRHGFLGNHQTHTVVARVDDKTRDEHPCCLVIRDPLNLDVFNVTIAPGIDPLLAICYLAVHSKMDVEPKLDAVFAG